MAVIGVASVGDDTYEVTVQDEGGSTQHSVTGVDAAAEARGVTVEHLLAASFRFLLDREPKEAILGSFDLSVISSYFPDYERSLGDYLRGS